ncbi:MAG: SCO family protein [Xanthobacteraceae bacterium]
MRVIYFVALAMLASITPAPAHDAAHHHAKEQRLPKIAAAPAFALTSQDGTPVSLADLRGKTVAVTFIYTSCTDACPVLTALMAYVQDKLGRDFGERIAFVSITVDPERDTPEVLKQYAETFGADLKGWAFLTGAPAAIRDVIRRYGVFAAKNANGEVDHTFLTSIVDRNGMLRVQYLGVRFDPDEFRRDLLSLTKEQ